MSDRPLNAKEMAALRAWLGREPSVYEAELERAWLIEKYRYTWVDALIERAMWMAVGACVLWVLIAVLR